jgi:hypothetical protein
MGLRDILKKKDDIEEEAQQQYHHHGQQSQQSQQNQHLGAPEFVFMRTDTVSQEVIQPPSSSSGDPQHLAARDNSTANKARRSLDVFRPRSRSRSASVSSQLSSSSQQPRRDTAGRRLSHRLHLSREPETSDYVPVNLPDIVASQDPGDRDASESQWEKRATILAGQNELAWSRPGTPGDGQNQSLMEPQQGYGRGGGQRSRSNSVMSAKEIDDDIQEAIRLHEEGDLARSTRMFGRLADPTGANNPLSQVLYGLALR